MHNGSLTGFHQYKRDLQLAVDPSLFADIEGSTDSETLFFLALTLGLTHHRWPALAGAVGLVENAGRAPRRHPPGADVGRDHRR